MARRDIVIGIIILLIVSGVVFFRQRNRNASDEDKLKVPQNISVESAIEEKFKLQIPDDVDKAELKDTSGGTGSAIATRKTEGNTFTLSILADLPEPAEGSYYEGWLEKGEEGKDGYSLVSAGRLKSAKGGWMQTFQSTTDFTDHSRVVVSLEKASDKKVEEKKLEGTF